MPRRRNEATATADSGKMTAISLRLSQPQLRQLRGRCEKTGLPMTEMIRRFIDEGLKAAA
jgi:predicted DNA binding CopG/RHH family protein